MKILIGLLLLGGFGAGTFHFAHATPKQTAPRVANACEASVTRTPEGNCLVTCQGPNGQSCSIEIACDGDDCHVIGCNPGNACPQACPAACR